MVTMLVREHPVEWRTASPLWDVTLADGAGGQLRQPVLLRFATDDFMQELEAALSGPEPSLEGLVARPETWEREGAGWLPPDAPLWKELPLKLYQPAHARFYLVAASLVCKLPGLPDRRVDSARRERAAFVLRKLMPRSQGGAVDPGDPRSYREYAWVPGQGWVRHDEPDLLRDGEERHPMFAVNFAEGDRPRRLLAGLVPVAARESYQPPPGESPVVDPGTVPGEEDPREVMLRNRVESALQTLMEHPGEEQANAISVFLLLDLAEWLVTYAPAVWDRIWAQSEDLSDPAYADLKGKAVARGVSWAGALRRVWVDRKYILAGREERFPDYDLSRLTAGNVPNWTLIRAAATEPYQMPEDVALTTVPKVDPSSDAWYVIRCAYERPHCEPLREPVVSEPTRPFQLAGFLDPDAPVRPVKITMPADTTVGGLRRFKKGVSILVSDKLRNQLERFRGQKLTDLDSGTTGSGENFSLGMVCSLSIPIITICALVLLLIIVQLLNIVFWWIPFLKICFPLRLKRG